MFNLFGLKKKDLDNNELLGRSCAMNLIERNKRGLKDQPLGLNQGELTDGFRKGFNDVVRDYKRKNHFDPIDNMEVTAQQMVNSGHDRFDLVIKYIVNNN